MLTNVLEWQKQQNTYNLSVVDNSEKISRKKNSSPLPSSTIKKEYSTIPATRKNFVFKSRDKNRTERRFENINNYNSSSNNHLLMIAPINNIAAKNVEQTIKTEIVEETSYRNESEDHRSLLSTTTHLTNILPSMAPTLKFQKQHDNTFPTSTLSVNKFQGPIVFKNNFLSVQIDMPKSRMSSHGNEIDKKLYGIDNGQKNVTNDCVTSLQSHRSYDTNLVTTDKLANSYHHVKSGSRTKRKTNNKIKTFSNEKQNMK